MVPGGILIVRPAPKILSDPDLSLLPSDNIIYNNNIYIQYNNNIYTSDNNQ